ncbi:MAG: DUF3575 domain-containing protein [Bacteroidales bacterium]
MKSLLLFTLIILSTGTAYAASGKLSLTELLERIKQEHQIHIAYSPSFTNRVIPKRQNPPKGDNPVHSIKYLIAGLPLELKKVGDVYCITEKPVSIPEKIEITVKRDTIRLPYIKESQRMLPKYVTKFVPPKLEYRALPAARKPEFVPAWSLNTNTLGLLSGRINIGTEGLITPGYSLGVHLSYSPNHNFQKLQQEISVRVNTRRWLNAPYSGQFLSSNIQYISLLKIPSNANNQDTAYPRYLIGTGFSYGYSWRIKPGLSLILDFGIGVFINSGISDNSTQENRSRKIRVAALPNTLSFDIVYILK